MYKYIILLISMLWLGSCGPSVPSYAELKAQRKQAVLEITLWSNTRSSFAQAMQLKNAIKCFNRLDNEVAKYYPIERHQELCEFRTETIKELAEEWDNYSKKYRKTLMDRFNSFMELLEKLRKDNPKLKLKCPSIESYSVMIDSSIPEGFEIYSFNVNGFGVFCVLGLVQ